MEGGKEKRARSEEAWARQPRSVVRLLGLAIANVTLDEAVDLLVSRVRLRVPTRVCFVNAHCVNVAASDARYRRCLAAADLIFADGTGMRLAGRIMRSPIVDNVNGTDLFPRLCGALTKGGARLFLLGAEPGVAEDVATWIRDRYPHLDIVGTRHGYESIEQADETVATIRDSRADILLVAMGVPKQELWIHEHLGECGVPVALAVGGLFDFYSGRARRAPLWMRRLGIEWLFRLCREPRRLWRRYLIGNWMFVGRVWATRRQEIRDRARER